MRGTEGLSYLAGGDAGRRFASGLEGGRFLFALVVSYTATCEIPGITAAGAGPAAARYTPPADAELIHYGSCRSVRGIPATPDGKPTPAVLTRAALGAASIPHLVVDAGSLVAPQMPRIDLGLEPGGNIRDGPAMSEECVTRAVDYGRRVGHSLGSLADCLVVGESVPGGTTTASAVLEGLGVGPAVSSSMPENPVALKREVAAAALRRAPRGDARGVVAAAGDPMIAAAAGMACGAAEVSRVLLAGGTQMAAVLAFAASLGLDAGRAAVGTTSYVASDPTADLEGSVRAAAGAPVICVDPGLERSASPGLRAYAAGFAKEGAGAGGAMISAMLRAGVPASRLRALAEAECARLSAT